MSTLSSANVTDVNLVLKERTHKIKIKYLCINILIFTHKLGNWPMSVNKTHSEKDKILIKTTLLLAGVLPGHVKSKRHHFNHLLVLCDSFQSHLQSPRKNNSAIMHKNISFPVDTYKYNETSKCR